MNKLSDGDKDVASIGIGTACGLFGGATLSAGGYAMNVGLILYSAILFVVSSIFFVLTAVIAFKQIKRQAKFQKSVLDRLKKLEDKEKK